MPWGRSKEERTCPTCLAEVGPSNVLVRRGADEPTNWAAPLPPESLREFAEQRRQAGILVCPACKNDLPDEFLFRDTFIVGLFGPQSASKSELLFAIVNELVTSQVLADFDFRCAVAPSSIAKYRKHYKEYVDQGKPIQATGQTVCITITVTRSGRGSRGQLVTREANLVFADAPGEAQLDPTTINKDVLYAYATNLHLLLVPPEAVPSFGTELVPEAGLRTTEGGSVERYAREANEQLRQVSSSLVSSLRRHQTDYLRQDKRRSRSSEPPFLGVVLTKADLLLDRPDIPVAAGKEPSYQGLMWEEIIDHISDCSDALAYAASKWGINALLPSANDDVFGDRRTYHLVAAIGHSRTENEVLAQSRRPFRVLDLAARILHRMSERELMLR